MSPDLTGYVIRGFPRIQPGDDLGALIVTALERSLRPCNGDVVCIASKIVARAEGRFVCLEQVTPGPEATALAREVDKDPRLVELILRESQAISRKRQGALIVRHRLGFVSANAAIDQSNVGRPPGAEGGSWVLLLPSDPDDAAARLHRRLCTHFGLSRLGVVITDSFGRPFRRGTVGIAVGAAGFPVIDDQRGQPDLDGRTMEATMVAFADQLAATAELLAGQGREGTPLTVLRGVAWPMGPAGTARDLIRHPNEDLYA